LKKFISALTIGACAGLLAALVVFVKGLSLHEILAYFFFWIGLSIVTAYTFTEMGGWLKGLLLAELFASPVFFLTIGSYPRDPLLYILANIILINGFIGTGVGYFNGLAEEEFNEKVVHAGHLLKKLTLAFFSGLVAGSVVAVAISLTHEPWFFKVSGLAHWIVFSTVLSFINVDIKNWLAGLIAAELMMIPVAVLFIQHAPHQVIPVLLVSPVLGAALGAFNEKYAKAVVRVTQAG
jgi:hypothetical protein